MRSPLNARRASLITLDTSFTVILGCDARGATESKFFDNNQTNDLSILRVRVTDPRKNLSFLAPTSVTNRLKSFRCNAQNHTRAPLRIAFSSTSATRNVG